MNWPVSAWEKQRIWVLISDMQNKITLIRRKIENSDKEQKKDFLLGNRQACNNCQMNAFE